MPDQVLIGLLVNVILSHIHVWTFFVWNLLFPIKGLSFQTNTGAIANFQSPMRRNIVFVSIMYSRNAFPPRLSIDVPSLKRELLKSEIGKGERRRSGLEEKETDRRVKFAICSHLALGTSSSSSTLILSFARAFLPAPAIWVRYCEDKGANIVKLR